MSVFEKLKHQGDGEQAGGAQTTGEAPKSHPHRVEFERRVNAALSKDDWVGDSPVGRSNLRDKIGRFVTTMVKGLSIKIKLRKAPSETTITTPG